MSNFLGHTLSLHLPVVPYVLQKFVFGWLENKRNHESYCAREAPAKTRYSGRLNSLLALKVAKKRPQGRFSYYMKEHGKVANNRKWKKDIWHWRKLVHCSFGLIWMGCCLVRQYSVPFCLPARKMISVSMCLVMLCWTFHKQERLSGINYLVDAAAD